MRRLTELMMEAQNILTEQDPPAIFYGERHTPRAPA